MDLVEALVVPVLVWYLAFLLGRRELRAYRRRHKEETDLFVYSKGRFIRRMTGVVALVATGLTLAAWDFLPPKTPQQASLYVGLLLAEVAIIVVLSMVDLWETVRTAKPEDLTRQGAPRRQSRNRRSRPQ
jgi:hypothetical protein